MKINLDNFDEGNYFSYKHSEYRYNLKDKLCFCTLCPFHRHENHERVIKRSWKQYRKTQYKPKEVEYEFG